MRYLRLFIDLSETLRNLFFFFLISNDKAISNFDLCLYISIYSCDGESYRELKKQSCVKSRRNKAKIHRKHTLEIN